MIHIRDRVFDVLRQTHLMSLGTMDADGVWVADVIFLYDDDLNIYWLSAPDTRHSKAIMENSKAAGTITFSTRGKEPNLGIQFEGRAERLEGVRFDLIAKHWAKRNHKIPDVSKALEVLEGDRWYKLTPTRIELVDEEHFGFDRQSVPLDVFPEA
ncbi:MAG: pyridoxamine 5'-phosphate oxidase family protein [Minisyncoccota bacterium]